MYRTKIENKFYRARIDSFVTQQQKNGMFKTVGIKDIFLLDFCEQKNDLNDDTKIQFFYFPDELKYVYINIFVKWWNSTLYGDS